MSAWWLAPLALTALTLAWYAVQRAWLAVMARPDGEDALARPGCAGPEGHGCICGAEPAGATPAGATAPVASHYSREKTRS